MSLLLISKNPRPHKSRMDDAEFEIEHNTKVSFDKVIFSHLKLMFIHGVVPVLYKVMM